MSDHDLQTIDPLCFEVVDSRIDAVQTGKLSLEAFCMILTDDDPFILVHNVIRVLSEEEFFATRPVQSSNVFAEQIFRHQLDMNDFSMMEKEDASTLEAIKKDLPNCPACRYKKHVNTVQRIAKKYKLDKGDAAFSPKEYKYPEVKKPIPPIVSTQLPNMYQMPVEQRKSCIECVEKHVAEAFILGNEVLMGYPDHFSLVCGHIGQAQEELPVEAVELKDILRFCLAKTIKDRKPFIPLFPIQGTLNIVRSTLLDDAHQAQNTESSLEIDITDKMRDDIKYIADNFKQKMLRRSILCKESILEYKKEPKQQYRLQFEGSMAIMADAIVNISQDLANMLRNRRLLFLADIGTAADSGYDGTDLIELFSGKNY